MLTIITTTAPPIHYCFICHRYHYRSEDESKPMNLCTGCHHLFTSSGYVKHVCNTTNRDCHIGYQQELWSAWFYDIRDEDEEMYGPQDEAGTLDGFQGDLFGQYDECDFEWPDDDGMFVSPLSVITTVLILMIIQWMLKAPILMCLTMKRVMRMKMRMKRLMS